MFTFRPAQLSFEDRNLIRFVADAKPAPIYVTCAACGEDCLSHLVHSIVSDEVWELYTRDYSLATREALICPDCLTAINDEYRPNDGSDDAFENDCDRRGRAR